ncbi:MAG: aspartate aminotransferase family protein [Solirubrobacterales bacterium]
MSETKTPAGEGVNPLPGQSGDVPEIAVKHVPGSVRYMDRARRVIPRGLASRGRVRAVPVAFERGEGAHLYDVDGNEYVDCVMALGPLLLGHSPRAVIDRAIGQLDNGIQFGGQHEGEAELAERVVKLVPCADKVVFANTGSEAVQAAVRIARATTGRRLLVKFEGHYHGWIDPLFVNSPGVPPQPLRPDATVPEVHNVPGQVTSDEVLVCRWNDPKAFAELMDRVGDEVAAVLTEPIPFNFGTFWPESGYLEEVARISRQHGALLLFDEIVSGFRLGTGGAQEILGVTPDIATYAKAVASGFPIALVAGTEEAMVSAVSGPVIHGGTYNGTPASVAAAIATIDLLVEQGEELYPRLDAMAGRLAEGFRRSAERLGAPLGVDQIGSVVQLLWGVPIPPHDFAEAASGATAPVSEVCERMLAHGVHVAPRGLFFLSAAHDDEDIDRVLAAFDTALGEVVERIGRDSGREEQ